MLEKEPALRILHDERETMLRALLPVSQESDLDMFKVGLGASDENMDLIEQLVQLSFEQSGLTEFHSLDEDPEALSRLNNAIVEPVQWLAENLPEVPDWFTNQWITHIIELMWKTRVAKNAEKRAMIREGKLPQTIGSARRGLEEEPSSRPPGPQSSAELNDMILRIEVVNDKDDEKPVYYTEITMKRLLLPQKPPNEYSSYSYTFLVTEFEKIINIALDLKGGERIFRLADGTIGYDKGTGHYQDDFRFKPFFRQQKFEDALECLYENRGEDNVLYLTWRNETAEDRLARLPPRTLSRPLTPPVQLNVSSSRQGTKRGRTRAANSRWRSPPPSPASPGHVPPLPPLPPYRTASSITQQDYGTYPEGAREGETPEQWEARVSDVLRTREDARNIVALAQFPGSHPDPDKTPKPITRQMDETPAHYVVSVVVDPEKTPTQISRQLNGPPAQYEAAVAGNTTSQATRGRGRGSRLPTRGPSARPDAVASVAKIRHANTRKSEPPTKMAYLVRGGGFSTGKSPAASSQTRIPGPAGIETSQSSAQTPIERTVTVGSKVNPSVSKSPMRAGNASGTKIVVAPKAQIKQGGTRKPALRDVDAKRTTKVTPEQDGPSRNPSQKAEPEWDKLTNPEDHRRTSPRKPKRPTKMNLALAVAKQTVTKILSPKTPKSPGSVYAGSDVQEIIDQGPKSANPLSPVSSQEENDTARKSTSSVLSRIASNVKDKEVVVERTGKKTFGVKIPKTRFVSKAERFASQNRRYRSLYTEIERHTYRRGGDEFVDDQGKDFEDVEHNHDVSEAEGEDTADEDDAGSRTEYMVEQFENLQDLPELSQMYDFASPADPHFQTPWEECCELFQMDPYKTSADERVVITGIKTPLYQYQIFGVYWQMKNSRVIGGGFVADEMGLGKTLSFLAYIVAERQLAFLWTEVEDARNEQRDSNDQRHLQPGQAGPDVVCPSRDLLGKGWIACPCASPVTSRLAPKPGVRLAIVPPSLVPTWVEQWDTHVESESRLQMTLAIAHDGSNLSLDGTLGTRDGRHTAVMKRVKSTRTNFTQGKRNANGHYYPDLPVKGQERVIVVTTKDHYNKTWGKKFEYDAKVMPEDKIDQNDLISAKAPGVVYGIAMIDECHEDFQKGKGRSALVASLPKAGHPFIWGYSGTPLTATPRSIEGLVWAIENLWPKKNRSDRTSTGLEQEQESGLWKYCSKMLDSVCVQFEKEVKKGNHIMFRDFAERYKQFLMRLMIRRTAETAWFGHPLIKIKPHIHQDVILAHNPEFDLKIEQFRWLVDEEINNKLIQLRIDFKEGDPAPTANQPTRFSFNSEMRLRYKQRLFATFPYLSVLGALHHEHHLDLTVEELKKWRGVDEKRNPYFWHLPKITESSPKMMWLYNFITKLDKTTDVNGEEQKIVIMSDFNQAAFIIKLWIEKYIEGKFGRVGIIYAGQKASVRKAIIEGFTDAKDQKQVRKNKINYQFLVGTTQIIGAGLQLTRSCNVVLMEPDYEFHRELQGYARVHRIGQKNPESHSYRLIDARDEVEHSILERQAARSQYPGRPEIVDVPDDEEANELGRVRGSNEQEDGGAAIESSEMDEDAVTSIEQRDEGKFDDPYAYRNELYAEYCRRDTATSEAERAQTDDEARAILSRFSEQEGDWHDEAATFLHTSSGHPRPDSDPCVSDLEGRGTVPAPAIPSLPRPATVNSDPDDLYHAN